MKNLIILVLALLFILFFALGPPVYADRGLLYFTPISKELL